MSTRPIEFLNESNRIEGIYECNYSNPIFQNPNQGHFGAYTISQKAAMHQEPLNAKMIREWQKLLSTEQKLYTGSNIEEEEIGRFRSPSLPKNVRIGSHIPPDFTLVPLYIMNYIEDINEDLKKNRELYQQDEHEFANFLGRSFLRFEKIHPFTDGNGRTGRLIANYLATYCHQPILVFPSDMSSRNYYIKAHESETLMQTYMAERLASAKASL